MPEVTGRCFCGAVRFKFAEPPSVMRMCWCRDCQYLAAGNASVNAIFRTETLEISGETQAYESTADSGNAMRRRFCPKCGTQLFSESSSRPGMMVVRVGTLDNREVGPLAGVIWAASAPSWAHIDADLPTTPGQPGAGALNTPAAPETSKNG
jgi:hypothetical protein